MVHAHGSRAATFARLADPQARRRVVYHVHGVHVDRAGSAARRTALLALERSLRPRTARFVTVCHADAARGSRLGSLSPARTRTVHNGIAWPPPPAIAGRFRAELGVDPAAPSSSPSAASTSRRTRRRCSAPGVAWRTHSLTPCLLSWAPAASTVCCASSRPLWASRAASGFVAPRPGLAEAYADADVFALSSRWEGLPYVLLEAMAHGLPVVSTAVDGVPEAVTDGGTGVLVPPGDTDAFGRALESLLADPQRRHRLGEAGRQRVSGAFALERMVDELVAVYRDVARGRASARV